MSNRLDWRTVEVPKRMRTLARVIKRILAWLRWNTIGFDPTSRDEQESYKIRMSLTQSIKAKSNLP